MPVIAISELHPVGSDLLLDSESFMNELTDSEITDTNGGSTPGILSFIGVSSEACGIVISGVTAGVAYTVLKK